MRKLYLWLLGIAASPFILFALLIALLYFPPVQRWAVGIATQYASDATGKEISIEEVSLKFPLDLQLNGVKALQRNDSLPQLKDTILNAQQVICRVQLRPLFDKKVELDLLQLNNARLNTIDFISDCRVKGDVGRLMITSHGIDLKADSIRINSALLGNSNLDICLSDTAKEDTTKTPLPWKIRVDDLAIGNSRVFVHMPGDTINIAGNIGMLNARNAYLDLETPFYNIENIDLKNTKLSYDNTYKQSLKGLDYNHLAFNDVNTNIKSLSYKQDDISVTVNSLSLSEKSGLRIDNLKGDVKVDSTSVHVSDLALATPTSSISGNVDMDFNAFADSQPGQLSALLDASISKADAMIFIGNTLPKDIVHKWPDKNSTIKGSVTGNMLCCKLQDVSVDIPTLAHGNITGTLYNLNQPSRLRADANLNVAAAGNNGTVKGNASYNAVSTSYNANLDINNLNLNHFLPNYGLGRFTGTVNVTGHGFDMFSSSSTLKANAKVHRFNYGKYDFSGSIAKVDLRNGKVNADIDTKSPILNGKVSLDAVLSKKVIKATVGADVRNIDFYALRMTKVPLKFSACGHIDIDTDLKDNFKILGSISDLRIQDSVRTFHPNDIDLDIFTRRDTTHVDVNCGDFYLNADTRGGYKHIISFADKMSKEFNHQISQRIIDEAAYRKNFITGKIKLQSGADNPIARFAKTLGYDFAYLAADITSSPVNGINGTIDVDTLRMNGIQLDDIGIVLKSDENNMGYSLCIANGEDNQYAFTATADGELMANGTTLAIAINDSKGRRGIDASLSANMTDEGIRINIDENKLILGYREFAVNDDNYVMLQKNMRVDANMQFIDSQGTGLQIYTDNEDATALQDITFSVHKLDIADIISVLPYMPKVTGIMDGDFHIMMSQDNTTISGDIETKNLVYENCHMGNISTELTYMPKDDGSHYIDGILLKDGEEIAMIEGTYYTGNNDRIDTNLVLEKMPMDIINGFIPDQIIGMKGIGDGTLSISGYVSQPVVNGTFDLSQASLESVPYGVSLKMDDTPVEIRNSKVVFNNFHFYASNDKPIDVNGLFDFSDLDHINADLRIVGKNILLVDAKENRRSEAYGKGYANIYGSIRGEMSKLSVRSKIEVLPSTNLYYVLRDSPITTDNRLKELVTFTDFSQEQAPAKVLPTVDGINISLDISVMDGSHIVCWLNSNHTNYLDIIGGGDLRFTYAQEKMSMTGRYTISEGEMKYSLPVIPLKTFTISNDSYIEFMGDVMNPRLNITATEQNRASVALEGNESRAVDFVCGVVLSKTLQDMGLQFIISAPEDQAVTDDLNMMSLEDRGKIAVTMLTTGMYLTDSNTSHITMNSALSSFLQQEINNIAGAALKTIDVSLGMENSTQPDGTFSTDYSFKFAKRFWNNRLSISIGGRISTGTHAAGKTPAFFDNVDVQYRLSDTSNQYVGLFYKHDVYDYLEGYVDEYGASYTWKRKLQNLKEILPWVKPETIRLQTPAAPRSVENDTIRNE